ncbi:hypothetical protein AAKU58_004354 [Oxalobacteraceae bacterium GrIS 1.18]
MSTLNSDDQPMSAPAAPKYAKCYRCRGTGWHTHGVCFDCNGLGIAHRADYTGYKRDIDALISELGKADIILHAMLNVMTLEQKTLVGNQLAASGVSPDGMIRANERQAILALFGV